jgi:hypothetical protein
MKKLSFDDLKEKSIVSNELLNSISGGLEASCHIEYGCDNCTVTIKKDGTVILTPNNP